MKRPGPPHTAQRLPCPSRAGIFRFIPLFAFPALLLLVSAHGGCSRLDGVPMPKPYDALGQVKLLDWILSEKPRSYRLLLADSFENIRPWRPRAASTQLSDVRFVYKTPVGRAFEREKLIIDGFTKTNHEQSLFIHTSFDVPGRQVYWLRPDIEVRLPGKLFRASLWVHSNSYLHRLVLLFENANGKEVRVSAGSLYWKGWRRLDLQLPQSLFKRGRRAKNRYLHKFTGFLIISHPRADPGDVALLLDNLIVLTDIREFRYPGVEYSDNW